MAVEWSFNLLNKTASAVDVPDLGFQFQANESVNVVDAFSYQELCSSKDLKNLINAGTIAVVYEGNELSAADSIDFLKRVNLYYLKQNYYDKTEIDSLLDAQGGDISDLQAEVDRIEAGAGLDEDGNYVPDASANYISGATSLANADSLLDAQIKANEDAITNLDNTKVNRAGDTMTGDLQMGTNEVFSAAPAPSDATALPNWGFIQTKIQEIAAGYDPKESVVAATTTNLDATYAAGSDPSNPGVGATLTANSAGALVVDGVTVQAGDRVLVWKQDDATQNGIYVVTNPGDASNPWVLTRATDCDGNPEAEVTGGAHTYAEQGNTYDGTEFVLIARGTVAVGTDPLNWTIGGGKAKVDALQAELDATQAGAGLGVDGTYTADASANYISGATSLFNADQLLDAQVKQNADDISALDARVSALENTDIHNLKVENGRAFAKDDVRNKWLGPQENYVFSRAGLVNNAYLYVNNQPSDNSGVRLSQAMTLVSLSVQLDASGSTTVEVYKNGTLAYSYNLSSAQGGQATDVDVDFAAGDTVSVRVTGTNAVEDPVVNLGFAFLGS